MVVTYLTGLILSSFAVLCCIKPTFIPQPPQPFPRPHPDTSLLSVVNWPNLLTNKSYVAASVSGYSYLPTYAPFCNYSISSSCLVVSARFKTNIALKFLISDLTSSPLASSFSLKTRFGLQTMWDPPDSFKVLTLALKRFIYESLDSVDPFLVVKTFSRAAW